MTTNAILTYLGLALALSAGLFIFLGIRSPRAQSMSDIPENGEPPRNDAMALAMRRANVACGALLLAVAAAAELVSFVQGGPAYGERSGNVPGGIVLIALVTLLCLGGCLVARQFILRHLRRKLAVQGRQRSG